MARPGVHTVLPPVGSGAAEEVEALKLRLACVAEGLRERCEAVARTQALKARARQRRRAAPKSLEARQANDPSTDAEAPALSSTEQLAQQGT